MVKFDSMLGRLREDDSNGSINPPSMFSGAWSPNGVVTPNAIGDEYINTTTWGKWYAKTLANNTRVEYNYTMDA